ncbi:hypothetical protein LEL_09050 [Akanthomyces lecanii RCEF 1005]|uniref:Uncharacterized protein n=1 Tax=Akanthomyces lecanii RCEF 1005 TaxID=1081108 RepID=A0A168CUS8_CORDF|nr:hypothetical protein LEL_09050 [Akanthomyces lecanii RCEF 1005]
MPNTGALTTYVQQQAPPPWTFATAEERMKADFFWAGHLSLLTVHVDRSHALHALWEEARNTLDLLFLPADTEANRKLDIPKLGSLFTQIQMQSRATQSAWRAGRDWVVEMPRRAQLLMLRYAVPTGHLIRLSPVVVDLLAFCDDLRLVRMMALRQDPFLIDEAWDAAERLERHRGACLTQLHANAEHRGKMLCTTATTFKERRKDAQYALDALNAVGESITAAKARNEEQLRELKAAEAASREALKSLQECNKRLAEAQRGRPEPTKRCRMSRMMSLPPASPPKTGQ